MKIGVKFCGGCQSRYDRGDVFENIKKNIENVSFEYVNSSDFYDILLVISGCHIKCAEIQNYKAKKIVNIDSENHKDAVNIVKNELLQEKI